MSDTSLPVIVRFDTTANRTAFTPTPGVAEQLYIWLDSDDQPNAYYWDGAAWQAFNAAGAGDVVGPASSTDEALARFDGITGKLLQDSLITLSNTGVLTFPDDIRQTFNPGANAAGLNAGSFAGNVGTPVNGDIWYDSTANALKARINGVTVSLGSGGGIDSFTDIYANRPAPSNDGDIFFPSDGFVIERDTGAAWEAWGPIFPFTAPVDGDFAWVNQGSSTVVTANGQIVLVGAGTGAAANLVLRVKTAPSPPYVITVFLRALIPQKSFTSYGVCFRESGTGEIHYFDLACVTSGSSLGMGARLLRSTKYTNATTFSADYTSVSWLQDINWFRIEDDNTDRICSVSPDGQNWLEIHSIGRTDFLTADQVGIAISTENTNTPNIGPIVDFLSWKET